MIRTTHANRTTGGSIRALTLALLVVASALAPELALADAGATSAETFAVTIDGTNSPVTEGDTLTVTATVENTGDVGGSQEISLAIDREERAHRTVELSSGESTTIELSWDTAGGDAGNYTASVHSENNSDATDVVVEDSATFSVGITGTNSPVTEGDTLAVTATVENTGDRSGTHNVSLVVGDVERDVRELSLEPGESATVDLTWSTSSGDAGNYTAEVRSPHSSESAGVTVRSPSFFRVSNVSTNAPVEEGEKLTVTATVENTGSEGASGNVLLTVGGSQRDVRSVSLEAGASTTVELVWQTGSGDAGNYTAAVASPNDTDSTGVTVKSAPSGTAGLAVADDVVTAAVGDVAEIGIFLNATNTATLAIGSEDANYHVTMELEDNNGDGSVTVLWNTHLAGHTANESEAWSAAGPDRVIDVERTTGRLDGPIEPTEYSISLSVGGTETGLGLASVFAPLAANRTIAVDSRPAWETVDTLRKNVTRFTVATSNDTGAVPVARGDWLVVRIDAPGTGGYVRDAADLAGTGTEGVTLSIEQTSTGPNEDPDTVAVEGFVTPDLGFANGTIVLAADTSSSDFELGETYEVTFVIAAENLYVEERIERMASFRVEEPAAAVLGGEPVEVRNTSAAELPGTTNLAAGTNLTVTVRSTGGNVPDGQSFLRTKTVTTDANGDWSATFDFSEVPAGQEFSLTVRAGGETLAETTGVVVDNPAPTVSIPRFSPTAGDPVTVEPTASDDGEIASYEWVVDGEVVSRSRVLKSTFEEPGDHEVRLTVTDDDGATATATTTVTVNAPPSAEVVVPTDTVRDGSITFDGTNSTDPDGNITAYEWRVDGEVVATGPTVEHTFETPGDHEVTLLVTDDRGATDRSSRTVAVAVRTTDAPTTADAPPTGVDTPGFGVAAGLVALAGAALLSGRWR